MKRKAVFLDKDGTLIPDIPYNVDPQRITLQADAIEGLIRLQARGYLLIIISNQSGVAKGYFLEEKLAGVEWRIIALLEQHGLQLTAFYFCPHHPDGTVREYTISCDFRKPAPGMLLKAAKEHHIDLESSWMIGDILNDVEAGNRAGCRTVLLNNGNETEWLPGKDRIPTLTCSSIDEAAGMILY